MGVQSGDGFVESKSEFEVTGQRLPVSWCRGQVERVELAVLATLGEEGNLLLLLQDLTQGILGDDNRQRRVRGAVSLEKFELGRTFQQIR